MVYPWREYWTSTEHPGATTQAAAFFASYDNIWLNQFRPKATRLGYTAIRGPRQAQKAPQCRDGYDNDGNGVADYPDDAGCSSLDDDHEWTCHTWVGFNCFLRVAPEWCFKIEDSTICLDLRPAIFVVVAFVVVWRFRRTARSGRA